MLWWVVLAVVVAAMLVLVLAVVAVLRRLPRLGRAAYVLRRHQAHALELRESAEHLEERLLTVQARADQARRRIAMIGAKRGR